MRKPLCAPFRGLLFGLLFWSAVGALTRAYLRRARSAPGATLLVLAYKRRVDAREQRCFARLAAAWRFALVPRPLFDPACVADGSEGSNSGEVALGGGPRSIAMSKLADVHLFVAVRRGHRVAGTAPRHEHSSSGAARNSENVCDASEAMLAHWQSELLLATSLIVAAATASSPTAHGAHPKP